jgi:hypothetical protein
MGNVRTMAETSSVQLPSGPTAAARSGDDDPSISFLLEAFLAERRGRSGRDAADAAGYHATVTVIDLLRGSLNRYGYHALSDADRERFEHKFFDEDDAEAFSELFGEAELRTGIPEFLDVHLPKRVHVDPSVVTLARQVIGDLVAWLDARATA